MLGIVAPAVDHIDEIHSSGFSNLAYLDVEQRRLPEAAAVLDVSLPLTVEFDLPVCHVWQLGARGRLGLVQGDWHQAQADGSAVLARPSAPLARTWAHLVRGLVALRRTGHAGSDLDDAWDLANRLGEPLRLMPAAAALVERVWLSGAPDRRVDEAVRPAPRLRRRRPGVGPRRPRGLAAPAGPRAGRPTISRCRRRTGCGWTGTTPGPRPPGTGWARRTTTRSPSSTAPDRRRCARGSTCSTVSSADAVAARLRQHLRDRGVPGCPPGGEQRTRDQRCGPDGSRGRGAALLDEGLTNAELASRLYISPKTADHHVSAILIEASGHQPAGRGLAGRERGILA